MTTAKLPWWHGATIYQVYPRSFADSNGDGIGDLPGVTEHLPYIASLGVDAIWLSPFFTSPMKDFGYDIADYRGVDPIFGTLQDFDVLVARAHELGLRLIIDQVYSHTSDQHAWFQQSRASRDNAKSDWYVWADARTDGSPPNNWQSVFGGAAWAWDGRRGQYYLHNFLTEQPDLNVHNKQVQNALLDCARFWLDRGVDGFRVDAINYAMHDEQLRDNPPAAPSSKPRTRSSDFQIPMYNKSQPGVVEFIRRIRALTDSYGDRFTVAEVGGADAEDEMHRFTSGTAHFNTAYGFNFLYADRLTPALVKAALAHWPENEPGRADAGWPSWAFSNHDAPRAVSRWTTPEHRDACARMCLALLVCLRGNIFLWQGEELGLPQAHVDFEDLRDPEAIANWPLTLGRDGARTPMPWNASEPQSGFSTARPWLPIPCEHQRLAVDVQQRDPGSMLALSQRLLKLRHAHAALTAGSIRFLEASGDALAFERTDGTERLLCVFNFGTQAADWAPSSAGRWTVLDSVGAPQVHRHGWRLPAWAALIAAPAV